MTIYLTKEVDVEIDLEDFSTEDLIEELNSRRQYGGGSDWAPVDRIRRIYELKIQGRDYSEEVDRLIDDVIGRIV